jgi:hypothetical protein
MPNKTVVVTPPIAECFRRPYLYFSPITSCQNGMPPASRVYEHACYWVRWGHRVTVVGCPSIQRGTEAHDLIHIF